jgi:hypothetical protein
MYTPPIPAANKGKGKAKESAEAEVLPGQTAAEVAAKFEVSEDDNREGGWASAKISRD